MSKKIKLSTEGREKIQKTFGVTHVCVSLALSYSRNSDLSRKIREMALKLGGKLYEVSETEVEASAKPIKILDSKGNVKKILDV